MNVDTRNRTNLPTFSEIVGDEQEFLSNHINKRALLRPGALAGKVQHILSIADLDNLLQLEIIRPPYIGITSNGEVSRPMIIREL